MKHRRGADHSWEVRRYRFDMAYYARCRCGYQYACGGGMVNPTPMTLYPYCPQCGARKKWYNDEVKMINDRYPWGEKLSEEYIGYFTEEK